MFKNIILKTKFSKFLKYGNNASLIDLCHLKILLNSQETLIHFFYLNSCNSVTSNTLIKIFRSQLVFKDKRIALCENLIGDIERYLKRKIQKVEVKKVSDSYLFSDKLTNNFVYLFE